MGKYIHVGGNQRSASCSKEINLKVKLFPFIISKLFPFFLRKYFLFQEKWRLKVRNWAGLVVSQVERAAGSPSLSGLSDFGFYDVIYGSLRHSDKGHDSN